MEFKLPEYVLNYEVNKLDPMPSLSEGMRRVIEYQNEHAADAFDTNCSLEEVRSKYVEERRFWNEGGPVPFKTVNMTLDGPMGEFPVRIHYPTDKPLHHAIIFIHGGGFTVGSNDTHDRMMRSVMASSGAAVIGVEYHLSPEAKFPIALWESAVVARYFHEHGLEHGILPDDMGICGDSGGGNLSLCLNLFLRDTEGGNDFISALLLYYGGFGLSDGKYHRLHGTVLDGMRKEDLAYYLNSYFEGTEYDTENPYYAPLNNNLTFGIPSTYMCCGDLDPLLDDSVTLQAILNNHGVKTELEVMPGCLHAYMHYGRMMDEALHCLQRSGEFYREVLAAKGVEV